MHEEVTLTRIDKLQEYIQQELDDMTKDTDTVMLSSKLMYHILLFCLENNGLNEHIIHNECWKYYELNKDELIEKIP